MRWLVTLPLRAAPTRSRSSAAAERSTGPAAAPGPHGDGDGGTNLYGYCEGGPVWWTDEAGTQEVGGNGEGENPEIPGEGEGGGVIGGEAGPDAVQPGAPGEVTPGYPNYTYRSGPPAEGISDDPAYSHPMPGYMPETSPSGEHGYVPVPREEPGSPPALEPGCPGKAKRPGSAQLRRNDEKHFGSKPPYDEGAGQYDDMHHDKPLSEGGTNHGSNLTPMTHDDHVRWHKTRGDFKRWGSKRGRDG